MRPCITKYSVTWPAVDADLLNAIANRLCVAEQATLYPQEAGKNAAPGISIALRYEPSVKA